MSRATGSRPAADDSPPASLGGSGPRPGEGRRVVVLGLRGFPDVQGGVEVHCQNLYPRLVERGFHVTALGRKGYIPDEPYVCQGVNLHPLWSPRKQSLEAICHTARGVLWAARHRKQIDLLHIHAIGPALLAPLVRRLGLPLVVTSHSLNYDHQKWGRFAKLLLRLGERLGARHAQVVISVSKYIRDSMRQRLNARTVYIPNGVVPPTRVPPGPAMEQFGLEPGRYFLAVGRLVPEKGYDDLIRAFAGLETDWKLAVVGGADHETPYSQALRALAAAQRGAVLTGFQKGDTLGELYSNAGLFVLPSHNEGLPIALLEAISYGLPFLASDILANREVAREEHEMFPVGDVEALRDRLRSFLDDPSPWTSSGSLAAQQERLQREFNWEVIADRTAKVYGWAIDRAAGKEVPDLATLDGEV